MSEIKKIIKELNPRAMFLSPLFDSALIGTSKTCGNLDVAAYSSDQCLNILIKNQKMDELEAFEYFQGTINSGKFNKNKPVFINDFRNIKDTKYIKSWIKSRDKNTTTINDIPDFPD
jgi:hypothetical protein